MEDRSIIWTSVGTEVYEQVSAPAKSMATSSMCEYMLLTTHESCMANIVLWRHKCLEGCKPENAGVTS